jgi:hypothetical protein
MVMRAFILLAISHFLSLLLLSSATYPIQHFLSKAQASASTGRTLFSVFWLILLLIHHCHWQKYMLDNYSLLL